MSSREGRANLLVAAAQALSAGRIVVRHLTSPALEPVRAAGTIDLDELARQLAGATALHESTGDDVTTLLALCEALASAGTEIRIEWMPKACCGDDVTEWETWTREVRSPKATRLLAVAADLRRFLARCERVRDLIAATDAVERLRRARPGLPSAEEEQQPY